VVELKGWPLCTSVILDAALIGESNHNLVVGLCRGCLRGEQHGKNVGVKNFGPDQLKINNFPDRPSRIWEKQLAKISGLVGYAERKWHDKTELTGRRIRAGLPAPVIKRAIDEERVGIAANRYAGKGALPYGARNREIGLSVRFEFACPLGAHIGRISNDGVVAASVDLPKSRLRGIVKRTWHEAVRSFGDWQVREAMGADFITVKKGPASAGWIEHLGRLGERKAIEG
jgi:hypothetical protein